MKRWNNYLAICVIAVSIFAMGQPCVRNIDAYFLERGNVLPRVFPPIWFLILPVVALILAFIGKKTLTKSMSFGISILFVINIILGVIFIPSQQGACVSGFEFVAKLVYCAYIVFVIFCGYICFSQDKMLKNLISHKGFTKKTRESMEHTRYYQYRALVYFAAAIPAAKGLFIDWMSDATFQNIAVSICIFIFAKLITCDFRLDEDL